MDKTAIAKLYEEYRANRFDVEVIAHILTLKDFIQQLYQDHSGMSGEIFEEKFNASLEESKKYIKEMRSELDMDRRHNASGL